jgi:ABC-type branched-subunit amino acid transport system permease subunit
VSAAWQYYIVTVLVFFSVNVIAGWGLNLQYGVAGLLNFGFIVFQAAGAYTAAVVTLGPSSASGGFQQYIAGMNLPWPLPLILGAAVGGALAFLVGLFALLPPRRDYQALVLIVVSIIATTVVSAQTSLFNGTSGLAAIPKPLSGVLNLSVLDYGWCYAGMAIVLALGVMVLVNRMTRSPWSRSLRATRDQPSAAASVGIDVHRQHMTVLVVGGALAGLSGALLVQFIGSWAPGGWEYGETVLYFAAIIVGGRANNLGVALGVAVVWTGFLESVHYIPTFGAVGGLSDALPRLVIGLLLLGFLWFRPEGLIPEKRRRLAKFRRSHAPEATLVKESPS